MARVNVRADPAAVGQAMEQALRDARPDAGDTNFKGWVRSEYSKIMDARRRNISWTTIAEALRAAKVCHANGKAMSTGTLIQYVGEIRREGVVEITGRTTRATGKRPARPALAPAAVKNVEAAVEPGPAAPALPSPPVVRVTELVGDDAPTPDVALITARKARPREDF
jgi:hypothetical protein